MRIVAIMIPLMPITLSFVLAGEFQPDSNTVALWHFNEGIGDTVYDASGNGNHGVNFGPEWSNGLFGGGLFFDGDDTVLVLDSPSLKPTDEITVEAYIRPDTNTWGAILSKWIYPQLGPGYGFGIDTPNVGGVISTTTSYYNNVSIPFGFNWNQEWYHFKLCYRAPFIYCFINDSLLDTLIATGLLAHNNLDLTIGVRNDGGPPYPNGFKGKIDEVRISGIARLPLIKTGEFPSGNGTSGIAAGDFDKDGFFDIVTVKRLDANMTVLLNSGNATFSDTNNYFIGGDPRNPTVADFDGDGYDDIAVCNFAFDNVSVFLNDGTGNFMGYTDYFTADGPVNITSADFNNDGSPDIATANWNAGSVTLLLNSGSGTFASFGSYPTGFGCVGIDAQDLNGDNLRDLATANYWTDNVSVLLNSGDSSFASAIYYTAGNNAHTIMARDLDSDSIPDIVVTNLHGSNMFTYRGNGNGTFVTPPDTFPTYTGPQGLVVEDLDLDGHPELVVSNVTDDILSVYYNKDNGGFGQTVSYGSDSYSEDLVNADLDNDGDQDLVLSNSGDGTVSVFLNTVKINHKPVMDSLISQNVYEGSAVMLTVTAADPDSESIYLSAMNPPDNSVFVDSGNGLGIFTFSPDTTQAGIHNITFIASDGFLADSQTVDITVNNCESIPGDANSNGSLSLADVISTVNFIFNKPGCNPVPLCWLSNLECRGDWNGDDVVTLGDVIQGVNYVFNKPGGPWNPVPVGVCCLPIN